MRTRLHVAAAAALALGLGGAWAWSRASHEAEGAHSPAPSSLATSSAEGEAPSPEPTSLTASPLAAPTPERAHEPAHKGTDDDGPDPRTVALAAIAAAANGDVSTAVTRIGETDLAADGYVAAKAIRTLARLASRATDSDRARVGARLASWLEAERRRPSPDALGNVSILAEELGKVPDPSAARALLSALEGGDLPLHIESRIVVSLGELGDPLAVTAVERFRARVPAPTGDDAFEDALRREAIEIADTARARLSRG